MTARRLLAGLQIGAAILTGFTGFSQPGGGYPLTCLVGFIFGATGPVVMMAGSRHPDRRVGLADFGDLTSSEAVAYSAGPLLGLCAASGFVGSMVYEIRGGLWWELSFIVLGWWISYRVFFPSRQSRLR